MQEPGPLVRVLVMVNVDSLRRGWTGEVELDGRIELLVRRGYLRVLGHVDVVPEPAPAVLVAEPPIDTPQVVQAPRRARKMAERPKEADGGDSAGVVPVE